MNSACHVASENKIFYTFYWTLPSPKISNGAYYYQQQDYNLQLLQKPALRGNFSWDRIQLGKSSAPKIRSR